MNSKISIKDIAQQLNVSTTTVSFIINGKAKERHISEAVTSKVLKLVAELDYQPNSLAKSLRTGKSKTVGFLVDSISDPFFSGIARLIDDKITALGYKILFSSTGNKRDKAASLLKIFKDRQVDGYIIAMAEGIEEEMKNLIDSNAPVVLFDRYIPEIKADYVLVDNFESTLKATRHLIKNGYRNPAFITVDTGQQQMIDRLEGYLMGVSEAGIGNRVLRLSTDDPVKNNDKILRFIKGDPLTDSIIFAANYITMEGLRAFRLPELSPRKDIALLSFDDFELLEFIYPPVTAIAQPTEAMAQAIVDLLMLKMSPDYISLPHSIKKMPGLLIERASTSAAKQRKTDTR